jgi:hypothetical protein
VVFRKKNLTTIDRWGGKFIRILPRTRREVTEFYEELKTSYPNLELAYQSDYFSSSTQT